MPLTKILILNIVLPHGQFIIMANESVFYWSENNSKYILENLTKTIFENYKSRVGTSDFGLRTSDFGLQTSDFGLQTQFKHWFRASLIANIAFAKLANISGTYSIKAIQTKVKNGKNDLDCKCRLLEYDVLDIYIAQNQSY